MTKDNRIIVALDYDEAEAALGLVRQLGPSCDFYKIGLQLLTAAGPEVVRMLIDANKRVFLDLKSFEIPNSVAGAVDSAGSLGASMVTVHASGGRKALEAAVRAAEPYPKLSVLGLTVVTSMTREDLQEVGINASVEEQVALLAGLAVDAGCQGLVASAREAEKLRLSLPSDTVIVTPGIQLHDTAENDQQRVTSPEYAIEAGADYLVIGRAITQAPDALAAFGRASRLVR